MNDYSAESKRLIQGAFDRGAATYGDIPYFPLLGEWLVETAAIPAGARVLDVACGRGAVLIPAARAVGPAGEAIGVDLAPAMVKETNHTLQQLGLTHARALQMDAENLAFAAEHFDFVLCGFALFFFPNLDHVLTELYRLLRPGGVIAVTTWGAEDSRWDRYYAELVPKYGAALRLTSHNLSRPEAVGDRLRRAGFDQIRHETKRSAWVFSEKEAWWSARWSVSGRVGLERLAADRLQQLKDETFGWMETLRQPDGFHESFEARCAVAVRPS